jgi:hypothetical protein
MIRIIKIGFKRINDKIEAAALPHIPQIIRLLTINWFTSRFIYIYNSKHDSYIADEMYWFTSWIGLIGFSYILRLILISPVREEFIKSLRSDLNKLGLMFVMMFVWEMINCFNTKIAYSDWAYGIMLSITGLLMALAYLEK